MLEATIARVSILEGRRDICYQNAFKATGGAKCIVRGCGAKSSSSFKNDVRHFQTISTPEHDIAAILLQQKQCLQCGEQWKRSTGLDHHERTVHQETRSSRVETFLPYLKQPLCKCFPIITSRLWLMIVSLHIWMSINPIIADGTGQSTAEYCRSASTQLVHLQRRPAVGRLNTCRSSTAPSAAWSREPPNPGVR